MSVRPGFSAVWQKKPWSVSRANSLVTSCVNSQMSVSWTGCTQKPDSRWWLAAARRRRHACSQQRCMLTDLMDLHAILLPGSDSTQIDLHDAMRRSEGATVSERMTTDMSTYNRHSLLSLIQRVITVWCLRHEACAWSGLFRTERRTGNSRVDHCVVSTSNIYDRLWVDCGVLTQKAKGRAFLADDALASASLSFLGTSWHAALTSRADQMECFVCHEVVHGDDAFVSFHLNECEHPAARRGQAACMRNTLDSPILPLTTGLDRQDSGTRASPRTNASSSGPKHGKQSARNSSVDLSSEYSVAQALHASLDEQTALALNASLNGHDQEVDFQQRHRRDAQDDGVSRCPLCDNSWLEMGVGDTEPERAEHATECMEGMKALREEFFGGGPSQKSAFTWEKMKKGKKELQSTKGELALEVEAAGGDVADRSRSQASSKSCQSCSKGLTGKVGRRARTWRVSERSICPRS